MTTRIISLVIFLCACGSSSSNGESAITGPVAGRIGGQSFTTQAVRADWTGGGEFLTLRFAPVDMAACPLPQASPVAGWTELDVNLVRNNALPGRIGSYIAVQKSAG